MSRLNRTLKTIEQHN